ncbi:MAG: hypothetical protein JJ900_17510 [Rhodospirillales bacterium]|nr:hypothetical protein [Rhodospirillales bacterium]MBO6788648.1 hypothetical protein [Rhodospirillales bacterium]
MSDQLVKTIMSINDMESVAMKLFNDAAIICFECKKRDRTSAANEDCPSTCGALAVLRCARDIVDSIETRDQVLKAG